MPSFKMRYFPARGRAEPIRMMFAYKNVPLEEELLDPESWLSTTKEQQPFKQLPVMFIDGKQLCQTLAIARFAGKHLGLWGGNEWESALVDQFTDGLVDFYNATGPQLVFLLRTKQHDKAKQVWEETGAGRVVPFMDMYERFLVANGGQWFVGKQVSFVDFGVAELLQRYEELFVPGMFDNHPGLRAHKDRVYALPGVKEYMAKRPNMFF